MKRRGSGQGATVTIADVARSVGVATSTVSRALTRPGRVSEATQRLILDAAAELGYVANPQARALTSGQTLRIALLVPDITNPYFFDLIRGTQSQLKARGYRHLLVDSENSAEIEETALSELPGSVDGMIVMGAHAPFQRLIEASSRVPVVVINREIDGIPSVIVDTPAAVVQALDYLVSLGHTDIAYIAGPADSWSSERRWNALVAGAQRHQVHCVRIGPFTPTLHAGAAAADAALSAGVTACLFFNDLLAIRALQRFTQLGVAVPEQMSVVGCDDIFGADFCHPPLTTLTAPTEHVGRIATDMLLNIVHDAALRLPPGPDRIKVSAFLTIRNSTAPVPLEKGPRSRQEPPTHAPAPSATI